MNTFRYRGLVGCKPIQARPRSSSQTRFDAFGWSDLTERQKEGVPLLVRLCFAAFRRFSLFPVTGYNVSGLAGVAAARKCKEAVTCSQSVPSCGRWFVQRYPWLRRRACDYRRTF